jgi:hypothetical protein
MCSKTPTPDLKRLEGYYGPAEAAINAVTTACQEGRVAGAVHERGTGWHLPEPLSRDLSRRLEQAADEWLYQNRQIGKKHDGPN